MRAWEMAEATQGGDGVEGRRVGEGEAEGEEGGGEPEGLGGELGGGGGEK